MPSHRSSSTETQPRTCKPTLRALLSLPFRICNPPPAVGKVRSCGVTPLFNVRLQDVLERRHLPPLGLKDFEEWLLYVEMSPENLYFTLWLKEYTLKYQQWAANSQPQRDGIREYQTDWPAPSSSQLAMFYARAKQTFFMPNSEYELNLASNILAPFHDPDGSPHPSPQSFTEIALETQRMLEESLRRFVNAQLNNVGTNRVLCGIIAGIFICAFGSLPPIVTNFVNGDARWSRLAAFPGMWLGLSIFLAAFNGVCLGVYIFGDLRQLHKFELSRPPISKPQPLPTPRQRPVISWPISAPSAAPILPLNQPPRLSIIPPSPVHIANHRLSRTSTMSSNVSSSSSSASSSSGSSYEAAENVIHISPAYYDPDPVDGPATSPVAPEATFTFPAKGRDIDETNSGVNSFVNTASFIHSYDSMIDDDDYDYDRTKYLPEERQPISAFDFDALPSRAHNRNPPPLSLSLPLPSRPEHSVLRSKPEIPPFPKSAMSLSALIERLQSRCAANKWLIIVDKGKSEVPCTLKSSRPSPPRDAEKGEAAVRRYFKTGKAVPAFASLTRVLSPIIVRGQWEIVVRSAGISFLITWIILGSLLAVPVMR